MHGKLTCELILELMSMDLETYLYKSRIPKSLSDKIKILISNSRRNSLFAFRGALALRYQT